MVRWPYLRLEPEFLFGEWFITGTLICVYECFICGEWVPMTRANEHYPIACS